MSLMDTAFNDVEKNIYNHMKAFSKFLPEFHRTWSSVIMNDVTSHVISLVNLGEQFFHVQCTKSQSMEDFEDVKADIKCLISQRAEDELKAIKHYVDILNKADQDLKSKLVAFENSTWQLDWDERSVLITGSALVPPLSKYLQMGLEFYAYFDDVLKNISSNLKTIDFMDVDKMAALKNSFNVNLNNNKVNYLITLTQYIDNSSAVL